MPLQPQMVPWSEHESHRCIPRRLGSQRCRGMLACWWWVAAGWSERWWLRLHEVPKNDYSSVFNRNGLRSADCCRRLRRHHRMDMEGSARRVTIITVTFFYISPQPHFDLEPDYISRKPIKRRFQRYMVLTEIISTFHAWVKYISQQSAHSNQWHWAHTDRHTKVKTLCPPVSLRSLGRHKCSSVSRLLKEQNDTVSKRNCFYYSATVIIYQRYGLLPQHWGKCPKVLG